MHRLGGLQPKRENSKAGEGALLWGGCLAADRTLHFQVIVSGLCLGTDGSIHFILKEYMNQYATVNAKIFVGD